MRLQPHGSPNTSNNIAFGPKDIIATVWHLGSNAAGWQAR
jgi:hypothetical protein